MYKIPIVLFFVLYIFNSALAQKSFTIIGKFDSFPPQSIKVTYLDSHSKYISEIQKVVDGKFCFYRNIKEPCFTHIQDINNTERSLSFFSDFDTIYLEVHNNDFSKHTVRGSQMEDDYQHYLKLEKQRTNGKARKKEPLSVLDVKSEYIRQHPKKYSSMALFYFMFFDLEIDQFGIENFQPLYDIIDSSFRRMNYGIKADSLLKYYQQMAVGKPIPQFSAIGYNNEKINNSSLIGKYWLIDFWGSWCEPCIKSIPHIQKIYNKYQSRGLGLLAIAGDDIEPKWKAAIQKYHTENWIHILDTESLQLVNRFKIKSYPSKILVDKNGIILGRYSIDNKKLEKDLKKLFSKSYEAKTL